MSGGVLLVLALILLGPPAVVLLAWGWVFKSDDDPKGER